MRWIKTWVVVDMQNWTYVWGKQVHNLYNIHGVTAVRENDTGFNCSLGRNTTEAIINHLDFPTAILCIRDRVHRKCALHYTVHVCVGVCVSVSKNIHPQLCDEHEKLLAYTQKVTSTRDFFHKFSHTHMGWSLHCELFLEEAKGSWLGSETLKRCKWSR